MTRFRSMVLGGVAALAVGGAASTAFALEPVDFQNRLNGATVGLPLGASAPAGLYTGLETAYLGWDGQGYGNQSGAGHVSAIAQAVPLLWSTGWSFLGASYSASAVAAFYVANSETVSPYSASAGGGVPFTGLGGSGTLNEAFYVVANPAFTPINLSWNLGNGWFTSAGFTFMVPVGTNQSNATNPDYWTLEPNWAISYLANNWVLSANFFYDFNTASQGKMGLGAIAPLIPGAVAAQHGFVNGDELYIDLTAAYKFGKWQIGPVGYFEVQTTNDSPGSGFTCATSPATCGLWRNFAIGGLVGYDFGPVDLQVWVTDSVWHEDVIDGLDFWTRLSFRLWGPEAPKPVVAKN